MCNHNCNQGRRCHCGSPACFVETAAWIGIALGVSVVVGGGIGWLLWGTPS